VDRPCGVPSSLRSPKRAKAHRSAPRRAVGLQAYTYYPDGSSDQFSLPIAGCRAGCPASVRIARRRLSRVALYGAQSSVKKSILPCRLSSRDAALHIGLGSGSGARSMKLSKIPERLASSRSPDHPGRGAIGGRVQGVRIPISSDRFAIKTIAGNLPAEGGPSGFVGARLPQRGPSCRALTHPLPPPPPPLPWHRGPFTSTVKSDDSAFFIAMEYVEAVICANTFARKTVFEASRHRQHHGPVARRALGTAHEAAGRFGTADNLSPPTWDHHERRKLKGRGLLESPRIEASENTQTFR